MPLPTSHFPSCWWWLLAAAEPRWVQGDGECRGIPPLLQDLPGHVRPLPDHLRLPPHQDPRAEAEADHREGGETLHRPAAQATSAASAETPGHHQGNQPEEGCCSQTGEEGVRRRKRMRRRRRRRRMRRKVEEEEEEEEEEDEEEGGGGGQHENKAGLVQFTLSSETIILHWSHVSISFYECSYLNSTLVQKHTRWMETYISCCGAAEQLVCVCVCLWSLCLWSLCHRPSWAF